jgi:hypothetical protein
MDIQWTDQCPESGEKRFVCAERFAREWHFSIRFRRRENWESIPPSLIMWETLLDAMERRYQRREGIEDTELTTVRKIVEARKARETTQKSDNSIDQK